MKIEIEISDETAACIWADNTWEGKYPRDLSDIIASLAIFEAGKYKREFPTSIPRVLAAYQASPNDLRQPPLPAGDSTNTKDAAR